MYEWNVWENKGARLLTLKILFSQIEVLSQISPLVFKCYETCNEYSVTDQSFGVLVLKCHEEGQSFRKQMLDTS